MECSRCKQDKSESKFPVFHGKRKGMVCRDCKNKRDGHQKPMAGICRHCYEPIVGRVKTTRYHTDEDHPDCRAAKVEHQRLQQQSYDRGAGKIRRKAIAVRAVARKKCVRCIQLWLEIGLPLTEAAAKAHPVKKGNYYYCEKCLEWANHHSDDCVGH